MRTASRREDYDEFTFVKVCMKCLESDNYARLELYRTFPDLDVNSLKSGDFLETYMRNIKAKIMSKNLSHKDEALFRGAYIYAFYAWQYSKLKGPIYRITIQEISRGLRGRVTDDYKRLINCANDWRRDYDNEHRKEAEYFSALENHLAKMRNTFNRNDEGEVKYMTMLFAPLTVIVEVKPIESSLEKEGETSDGGKAKPRIVPSYAFMIFKKWVYGI